MHKVIPDVILLRLPMWTAPAVDVTTSLRHVEWWYLDVGVDDDSEWFVAPEIA